MLLYAFGMEMWVRWVRDGMAVYFNCRTGHTDFFCLMGAGLAQGGGTNCPEKIGRLSPINRCQLQEKGSPVPLPGPRPARGRAPRRRWIQPEIFVCVCSLFPNASDPSSMFPITGERNHIRLLDEGLGGTPEKSPLRPPDPSLIRYRHRSATG